MNAVAMSMRCGRMGCVSLEEACKHEPANSSAVVTAVAVPYTATAITSLPRRAQHVFPLTDTFQGMASLTLGLNFK